MYLVITTQILSFMSAERVFIIPYKGGMQLCSVFAVQTRDGVVSNYTCSDENGGHRPSEYIGGPFVVRFGVVGARPIALSLDMVWVDHYPVTLDLRLHSSMALNDTLIHVRISGSCHSVTSVSPLSCSQQKWISAGCC